MTTKKRRTRRRSKQPKRRDLYVPLALRPHRANDLAVVCLTSELYDQDRRHHLRGKLEAIDSPAACGARCDFDLLVSPIQWRQPVEGLAYRWCAACETALGGKEKVKKRILAQDLDMRTEPKLPRGFKIPEEDDWL